MNGLSKDSVNFVEIDESGGVAAHRQFPVQTPERRAQEPCLPHPARGEVRVNKKRVDQTYRLKLGDLLRIPPIRVAEKHETEQTHIPAVEFPVLYEDDAILAVNKPAGVAVHGGSGVSFGVIEQMRSARPQAKFLELVHRLDRETSGVLLLAKKRSALTAMHEIMREGNSDKRYFDAGAGAMEEREAARQIAAAQIRHAAGREARDGARRRAGLAHHLCAAEELGATK